MNAPAGLRNPVLIQRLSLDIECAHVARECAQGKRNILGSPDFEHIDFE
jgi:hypothetical protein